VICTLARELIIKAQFELAKGDVEPAYYRQHCGLAVENQLKETIRGYQDLLSEDGFLRHWPMAVTSLLLSQS